jgi:hypothetical protein
MSAAYYDLYAEENSLFVAKLNILTPEGVTAQLKASGANSVLYVPPELKAIGVTVVTSITSNFTITQGTNINNLFNDSSSGQVVLDTFSGDHNVVLSKNIGKSGNFIPGKDYVYELSLNFVASTQNYTLRFLQGKFFLNKTQF